MRGGHSNVSKEDLAKFPSFIKSFGCSLASEHQTQKGIVEAENALTPTFIHDRDYAWLIDSSLAIFEISNPSLGFEGEISDMLHLGKPVLLLYKKELEQSFSAYIRRKEGSSYFAKVIVTNYGYTSLEDAQAKIGEFISKNVIAH